MTVLFNAHILEIKEVDEMYDKEATERLKELLERGKIGDVDDIIDAGDCIALALGIKALEKQVPMEWIDDGHHLTCPMCETNWTREELLKYCGDCGQRLKTD